MGSLKISSDTQRPKMSLFKAPLWKSVLAALTLTMWTRAGAAPVELVAGRVVTHTDNVQPVLNQNLGFVGDIHSLRSLFSNGIPAGISLVRTVPHAQVHTVPTVNTINTVRNLNTINTVRTLPVSSTVLRNTPHVLHSPTGVSTRHHVIETPAVSAVRVATPAPVVAPAPVVTPVRVAPAPVVVQTPRVTPLVVQEEESLIPANYNFGYSVSDVVSGDSKTRQETREGDLVTGSYSVADPDGRIRTVTYTADPVHGFQAKVTYDGQEGPVAIPFNPPVSAPVSPVAPVVTQTPVIAPVQSPAPAPAAQAEEVIIAKDQTPEAETESVTESVTSRQQQPSSTFRAVTAVPAVPLAPRVSTAQRLLTTFPEIDLSQYLRFLNSQHRAAVHHLPSNPALHHLQAGVRNVAGAPVDLGQFTFLSGGQVLV